MTLVSPAWLAERLSEVIVLDASWHMPGAGRNAEAEFEAAHIPGAQRFDIDRIADTRSGLPHTLPAPDDFARMVGALGIGTGATVVAYEAAAPFSAPRAWWMFRVMGHNAVHVLDGGLARWITEGHPVETGPARPRPAATFHATLRPEFYADANAVAAALAAGTVADARSAERFAGQAPEPRPGVRPGHMPGAKSLPYARLVGPDGRLRPDDELRAAFAEAGLDLSRPVITTCGSGVTAAILALAAERLGGQAAVYDGSWTEWGADPTRPTATGPA